MPLSAEGALLVGALAAFVTVRRGVVGGWALADDMYVWT